MLDAVSTWRDAVADMIPEVPRGVPASTRISEEQVLAWIEEDRATIPADLNGQGIVYRFDIRDYCGHALV